MIIQNDERHLCHSFFRISVLQSIVFSLFVYFIIILAKRKLFEMSTNVIFGHARISNTIIGMIDECRTEQLVMMIIFPHLVVAARQVLQ